MLGDFRFQPRGWANQTRKLKPTKMVMMTANMIQGAFDGSTFIARIRV